MWRFAAWSAHVCGLGLKYGAYSPLHQAWPASFLPLPQAHTTALCTMSA